MLSDYLDEIVSTKTHDAYEGVPLATHSSQARGHILERVARRLMEETTGGMAFDPSSGVCIDGRKRGRSSANYDFMISGRRVEVKNSQLSWSTTHNRWVAHWQNVKRDEYDDLLLLLYTPFGVYVYLHNNSYGVSTSGMQQHSRGGKVVVCAPRNEPSISVATDAIRAKLAPMYYATIEFSDFTDLVTTTTTHDAYVGVPLATHSSCVRGRLLEGVVRRLMEKTTGKMACDPPSGLRIDGRKRGRVSANYDFMIGGRRVEVKNAQLSWETTLSRWSAQWCAIKRDEYDDLILVLYTPYGVHVFMHDHVYAVSTHGRSQGALGGKVFVHGPCREPSISHAMGVILKKMEHMHYAFLSYS